MSINRNPFRYFLIVITFSVFFQCDDDPANEPSLMFSRPSVLEPTATSAEISHGLGQLNNAVPKEAFLVYDTKPGPTLEFSKKISININDFRVFVEELTPATTYYVKTFAIDQNNKAGESEEMSFKTKEAELRVVPQFGKRSSVIEIGGNFFHSDPARNVVEFRDIVAEVVEVTKYTLRVIVPEDIANDEGVEVRVTANGQSFVAPDEFYINYIDLQGMTPMRGRPGDKITVTGLLPVPGTIHFSNTSHYVPYTLDNPGTYSFNVPDGIAEGEYQLRILENDIHFYEDVNEAFIVLPPAWEAKGNFPGTGFEGGVSFVIGNKAYIGLGYTATGESLKFYEFNMETGAWSTKADFPGSAMFDAVAFSIGSKGYVATGHDLDYNLSNEVWEYNPETNTWTAKSDFPGGVRASAVAVSSGDKAYVGLGRVNSDLKNDWWQYNPSTDTWIQKTDFAGAARESAVAFGAGENLYVGGGSVQALSARSDFWKYNPTSDTWTQISDLGGRRGAAVAFSLNGMGYVGTGYDESIDPSADFWQYDPSTDEWTKQADFEGESRWDAVAFSSSTHAYVLAGSYFSEKFRDLWQFNP